MADGLTVQIEGLDEVVRRLKDAKVREQAQIAMVKATALVVNRVAKYPPPPPNSTYRRTGDLGRHWDTDAKTSADDVIGTVKNDVRHGGEYYANKVQGPDQEWFHKRTGWPRVDEVAKQSSAEITQFFMDALEKAV